MANGLVFPIGLLGPVCYQRYDFVWFLCVFSFVDALGSLLVPSNKLLNTTNRRKKKRINQYNIKRKIIIFFLMTSWIKLNIVVNFR